MYTAITKQNSEVLIPFIDNVNSPDYLKYHTLSSGIVLSGNHIYALSSGTVLFLGKSEDDLYTLTIQYNASQCFCYCLLKTVSVSIGDVILKGMYLGTCDGSMRFEYLTSSKHNSIWAVRVSDRTFYKQNPTNFANGSIEVDKKIVIKSGHHLQTVFRSTP